MPFIHITRYGMLWSARADLKLCCVIPGVYGAANYWKSGILRAAIGVWKRGSSKGHVPVPPIHVSAPPPPPQGRTAGVRSGIAWQHASRTCMYADIFQTPVGDVSEDQSVRAELRPRVKLRSHIVTLRGTRWRARAAANESLRTLCTGSMRVNSACEAESASWADERVSRTELHV